MSLFWCLSIDSIDTFQSVHEQIVFASCTYHSNKTYHNKIIVHFFVMFLFHTILFSILFFANSLNHVRRIVHVKICGPDPKTRMFFFSRTRTFLHTTSDVIIMRCCYFCIRSVLSLSTLDSGLGIQREFLGCFYVYKSNSLILFWQK